MARKTPPDHLSRRARKLWRAIRGEWVLEDHHVHLLTHACEAFDRATEAREIVEAEGAVYEDRFGQPKDHPAVKIERDSRREFRKTLRELNLDDETVADARPPRR